MAPFNNRNLFIFFLFISFNIVAQTDFTIEKSGVVKTKKTDDPAFVLKKPDGGIYVLVYNYKREIQYVNEFDGKMKLIKSTKIRATNDRIVAANLENGKIKLFAVEIPRGKGQVLAVNFENQKLEVVQDDVYDLDLKKKSIRKRHVKEDDNFNQVNEKMPHLDRDASLYTFKSDMENFTLLSTLHNYTRDGITVFSDSRPRETSTHSIIKLDKDLNVVDNKEVKLVHKGFKDFELYKIEYFEDNDTYIFYGKGEKAKNKKRSKEERKLDEFGFETIYVVRGDQKPKMIQLQDYDDLLGVSKSRIIDNTLSVASLTFTREFMPKDTIKTGIIIQNFSLEDLKPNESTIKFSLGKKFNPYTIGKPEGNLNDYVFRVMDKVQDKWVFGIYYYATFPEYMSFGVGQNERTKIVSSKRIKGDFNVFVIDSKSNDLVNCFKLQRKMTRNRTDRIYNVGNLTNSGRYEFWNHGVFSRYRDGKFNFIVNANDLELKTDTLTYINSNLKSDKELLKSKPYLITLDLKNGFEYQPLLKTGTSLNGLMVEKMLKISENEYITNTPKPKEKRYVKITLD